MSVRGIGKVDH